ncbi:MAG: xylan 1,4-beta-xylosidase [Clostridiales bacterium]|nr:xylan 1,4-beta-xylosidase [Clostridiales bacterium]
MANPILPVWEHIPDGEPRVFGDRVYLYGSHDRPYSDSFCDIKLKVWSASVNDLDHWVCHGDSFHVKDDEDHKSSVPWEARELYAPDVVEKDGKYYLFAYLFYSKGAIGVSDRPEGPFKLIDTYQYEDKGDLPEDFCNNGVFVDPGVLVDDDGSVYVYCGFEWSYGVKMSSGDITRVLPETYVKDILPAKEPFRFYEACSPRKIGNTYYIVYSPRRGSCLDYATSDSPLGPYTYRGTIIDNGIDYPGGNNHGGLCCINGQWYIFYHRTSNKTVFSRQACVERVDIQPDGTIRQVEMTSLGFQSSLDPYEVTSAHIACVLKGNCCTKLMDPMTAVVADIMSGDVIGYKYFDFGDDFSATSMKIALQLRGNGERGRVCVLLDDENGEEIANSGFEGGDQMLTMKVRNITGRHALYFVFRDERKHPWDPAERVLCAMERFVFMK